MSESCMTEFVCFRAVRAAGSLVTAPTETTRQATGTCLFYKRKHTVEVRLAYHAIIDGDRIKNDPSLLI
jgi:hypothetical protein